MKNVQTQVQTVFARGWTSLHCNAGRLPSDAECTDASAIENDYKRRPALFTEWIKTHPRATVKLLAEEFKISYTTAAYTVRSLVNKKIIIDESGIHAHNILHFYSINPAYQNKH